MPKVSIVMNSYNHGKYVAEAIQSILDQTYQDFEIVITDDGSTDGTVTEIKKFTDPRIKLFCFENNRGACVAKRKCLDEAKGEFIAVLNSDDMFLPDKLEKQVKFLDQHQNIGAVFSYAQIIDEEGNEFTNENHFYFNIFKQPNRTRFEWLNRFFYEGNCLCHPSVLIRRECYDSLGYYDSRYAQLPDLDFWIRLCMKYNIHIMPEDLIRFRIRDNDLNVSGSGIESKIRHLWESVHVLRNYLNIVDVDTFCRVFSEVAEFKDITPDLIPFALAKLASESDRKDHQIFALEVMSEQLGNSEIAQKIETKFAFRYIDFIHLTGNLDVCNVKICDEFASIHNSGERSLVECFFPQGTLRRKTAKAFYLLIFDWNRFKQSVKRDFYLWRRGGFRAVFPKAEQGGKQEGKQVTVMPESALAHKYCIGKGLEIGGSAPNPFGLDTLNLDFTDSMDTEFKKEEIRLCGKTLKVDIVANGDDIPLPDESQDFIVSSHVIEHFPNPIKALIEWDRLVKVSGIIFMIVPHKERTFDRKKECTPLEHLIEDFKNNNTQPHSHPNGHDHCWVTETFVELINYMIEKLHMEWEIVQIQDVDDKVGNGFTVVIRKTKTHKPVKSAQ